MKRATVETEIVDDGRWLEDYPTPVPAVVSDDHFVLTRVGEAALSVVEYARNCVEIGGNCDSPIEQQLGAAILSYFRTSGIPLLLCKTIDLREHRGQLVLVPQYRWSIYRTDWAILRAGGDGSALLIECDGQEFHSTASQREHDRKKDAAAADYGHLTLRFSGSQIWREPKECAATAFDIVRGWRG